jgi:dipeptidyl aminopeptidase/acylaminoacyl peptidase
MVEKKVAPYGSWQSPITPDLIVSDTIRLGQIALEGKDTYWTEGRPSEGGRYVVVRQHADGATTDINPLPLNARTRVHEYGGGDYVVNNGTVYFANFTDQRLYHAEPGAEPVPLTPAEDMRYADLVIDQRRNRLVCVCEDHTNAEREEANMLISLPLDGSEGKHILAAGNDFYAAPRLSPDGSRLAWLTWNHPNMPWDGCELWVAELDEHGFVSRAERIAGGPTESIFQPSWSADGILYFISDRTNWWNLYRWHDGNVEPLCPREAEFGIPHWVFAQSTYAFVSPDRLVCNYEDREGSHLSFLDVNTGTLTPIELSYTGFGYIQANTERIVLIVASPTESPAIIQIDVATMESKVLRRSSSITIDQAYISIARHIEFPTEHELTAFAYYYEPCNANYQAPQGELPPLLVISHGGPTASTSNTLSLQIQFWTSRGFAVLDVDYGGSTGYGREYRERLRGQWGVVDVNDCINGAKYLVSRGLVDGKRLAIRGGSAGGYTTLCALTFSEVFSAGASHFGVSDLEVFVHDTHKFESRYLDGLVGPFPEKKELYHQRSAINYTDQLSCPVIFFQGLEDKIVPPSQAEIMVEALRAKHLPVAYLAFEGEQHGFRRSENIKRTLEAELYFYSKVFKFDLSEAIEPVLIENL